MFSYSYRKRIANESLSNLSINFFIFSISASFKYLVYAISNKSKEMAKIYLLVAPLSPTPARLHFQRRDEEEKQNWISKNRFSPSVARRSGGVSGLRELILPFLLRWQNESVLWTVKRLFVWPTSPPPPAYCPLCWGNGEMLAQLFTTVP